MLLQLLLPLPSELLLLLLQRCNASNGTAAEAAPSCTNYYYASTNIQKVIFYKLIRRDRITFPYLITWGPKSQLFLGLQLVNEIEIEKNRPFTPVHGLRSPFQQAIKIQKQPKTPQVIRSISTSEINVLLHVL